ncbi:hypothetical protein DDW11_02475 [Sulfolobus sp. SCGC AB-777_G06]|nr:hypothetical protein DDW11_02475 [Sulfolobus sp. SCGC AB-777_G06]
MAEEVNKSNNNSTITPNDSNINASSEQVRKSKGNKSKTSQGKKKNRRNWIKVYTANVDQFVTLKGRIRALTLEIVKDTPLITFSELLEKLKTRDEFIRKYLSGEVQISRRKATSQEITIRKILDGMAKEGLILKIQLNDEPFLRFALPEQLEYLRQQGLRIA